MLDRDSREIGKLAVWTGAQLSLPACSPVQGGCLLSARSLRSHQRQARQRRGAAARRARRHVLAVGRHAAAPHQHPVPEEGAREPGAGARAPGPCPSAARVPGADALPCQVALLLDFKLDESYTPSRVAVRAGTTVHDLRELQTVDLEEPVGWVPISLRLPNNTCAAALPGRRLFIWLCAAGPAACAGRRVITASR